jgi:hypothetical protein
MGTVVALVAVSGLSGCTGSVARFADVGRAAARPGVGSPSLATATHVDPLPVTTGTSTRSWTAVSAGPRMGALLMTGNGAEALRKQYDVDPFMTAWGWQFEYQYIGSGDGPIGLVEFVPLVIGLDQGLTIPSANLLFGMRLPNNVEFAAGPNVSPNGSGMCVAVGKTFTFGSMRMPVNAAIVSSDAGVRYSVTLGWNLAK